MSDLPHLYRVKSVGTATGTLISSGNNLAAITAGRRYSLARPVINGRPKIYLWRPWLTALCCHLELFQAPQS